MLLKAEGRRHGKTVIYIKKGQNITNQSDTESSEEEEDDDGDDNISSENEEQPKKKIKLLD